MRRLRLKPSFAAFVDVGRFWTDWRAVPELDDDPSNPVGLKVGGGGRVTIATRSRMAVRISVAGSPDGVQAYIGVGRPF